MDIESIEIGDYIDSSFDLKNTEESFINYLKNTQWKEQYSAKIQLRFYVKWIPVFKIEKYIKDFVWDFTKFRWEVWKTMWNPNLNSGDRQKLTEINSVMTQLQGVVIVAIQKSLSTKDNIEESYKQVNIYKSVLEDYKATLEQINNKLWNTAK